MAVIKSLHIHPIKSVPGVEVEAVSLTENGIMYGIWQDRGMVVLDKDNRLITLKQEGKLCLIKTTISEDQKSLILSAPGMDQPLVIQPKQGKTPEDQIISTSCVS